MDDNNNNNTLPWYLRGNLKDWAIIVGVVGFFYINVLGSNASSKERQEAIASDISDIKNSIKDSDKGNQLLFKEIDLRLNKMHLELELLKTELNSRK